MGREKLSMSKKIKSQSSSLPSGIDSRRKDMNKDLLLIKRKRPNCLFLNYLGNRTYEGITTSPAASKRLRRAAAAALPSSPPVQEVYVMKKNSKRISAQNKIIPSCVPTTDDGMNTKMPPSSEDELSLNVQELRLNTPNSSLPDDDELLMTDTDHDDVSCLSATSIVTPDDCDHDDVRRNTSRKMDWEEEKVFVSQVSLQPKVL
jgi:hypothetical protein